MQPGDLVYVSAIAGTAFLIEIGVFVALGVS
jgi:hypothetical protein